MKALKDTTLWKLTKKIIVIRYADVTYFENIPKQLKTSIILYNIHFEMCYRIIDLNDLNSINLNHQNKQALIIIVLINL